MSNLCGKIIGADDLVYCSAPDVGVEPELAKMYFSQLILGLVSHFSLLIVIMLRHGIDALASGAHTFQGDLSSGFETRKFAFGVKW